MAVRVGIRSIIPKKLNVDAYRIAVKKALLAEGRDIKKSFEKTTRTWTEKVRFENKQITNQREWLQRVSTRNEQYFYVTRGTRVRWALMSQDFSPKTRARVIGSRRGRGGAVIMGKRAMQRRGIAPRPGIEGRDFDKEIAKREERPFRRKMMVAMKTASNNAF